jgi:hypothetical protein
MKKRKEKEIHHFIQASKEKKEKKVDIPMKGIAVGNFERKGIIIVGNFSNAKPPPSVSSSTSFAYVHCPVILITTMTDITSIGTLKENMMNDIE